MAEDGGEFLDEVRPVSRLFQLSDGAYDNVVLDAVGIDCVHRGGARGGRRSVFGQSRRRLDLDADVC